MLRKGFCVFSLKAENISIRFQAKWMVRVEKESVKNSLGIKPHKEKEIPSKKQR